MASAEIPLTTRLNTRLKIAPHWHSMLPTVSQRDVLSFYCQIDTPPREDVLQMICLYPQWHQTILNAASIGNLMWYFDQDPSHVSQVLTTHGTKRRVIDCAQMYEYLGKQNMSERWAGAKKVESMVEDIQNQGGGGMEPLIIIPRDRYPNSPESSFIDGVHRGLACMLFALREGKEPGVRFFIGEKDSLWNRLLKKIRQTK